MHYYSESSASPSADFPWNFVIPRYPRPGCFPGFWIRQSLAAKSRAATPASTKYGSGVSPPSGWSDWITPVDNRPDARAHSYLAQIVSRELERIMRYSTGWTTSHRNEPKEEMNHLKESGRLQNLETH